MLTDDDGNASLYSLFEDHSESTFKETPMKTNEKASTKLVLKIEALRNLDARPARGGEFCLRSMALAINA